MAIKIDYTRDSLFDEVGLTRLRESYMRDDEKSPQERYAFVCNAFGSDEDHAQRMYDYASMHWLSFSTPVLSFGRTKKGLPISCFLNYIDDTSEGLVNTLSETNWLSMLGGGVGVGFGIRASDERSTGVMAHLKTYDSSCLAYRQGSTRRGSYAVYLDISHPDIEMFLDIRKPTGDQNMRALNLHHGVNISDAFMEKIEGAMLDKNFDDTWELIDPKDGAVRKKVSAKELWMKILDLRMHTGEPYMHFIDTSNRHLPYWLKDKGLRVNQSNLCSEIILPTNKDRTAVCCLSSLVLEYYDEWKDHPTFLYDVAMFLDNVLQYFIDTAPDTIARAKYSAMRERSIGVGALGLHAYLQKHNIAFEDTEAKITNKVIFKNIRKKLDAANIQLGTERGEAPDAVGTGLRFSHLIAIAPNASSSIIVGNTSPSIEPFRANVYRQDTLSGASINRNKYLDAYLKVECELRKLDITEVWSDILQSDGSIQHIEWIDDHTKEVFKTAMEIDQRVIVELAADRQEFIDQAQSLNLFFLPNVSIAYLHAVHFMAWKKGLKSLYYCRSEKIKKTDKVSKAIERVIIEEIDMKSLAEDECLACQG